YFLMILLNKITLQILKMKCKVFLMGKTHLENTDTDLTLYIILNKNIIKYYMRSKNEVLIEKGLEDFKTRLDLILTGRYEIICLFHKNCHKTKFITLFEY
ncbi:hypothetical protein DMUE_5478, partial [Dictyocoela muelleri]